MRPTEWDLTAAAAEQLYHRGHIAALQTGRFEETLARSDGVVLMQERFGCPGRPGDLNRLRHQIPGRLKGVAVSNCSSPAQRSTDVPCPGG